MKDRILSAALAATATLGLVSVIALPVTPAHAFIVFDPSNYAQNLLTAARSLEQIDNQIRSLQNEAQMLTNMAKNLSRIDFPQLQEITQTLQAIDRLMGKAQGIGFHLNELDAQFRQLYPDAFDTALRTDQRVQGARTRLDTSMAALRHTMEVQSQIVENVHGDAAALAQIVAKSQGAEGSLQAQQATNQLLALTAKQQFQLQEMMAAQFRSDAIERARQVQETAEARAATRRFLGSGHAYTPR